LAENGQLQLLPMRLDAASNFCRCVHATQGNATQEHATQEKDCETDFAKRQQKNLQNKAFGKPA
jgi:hypothetical protein